MNPLKLPILKVLAIALLVPFAATPVLAAKKAKTPVISATDAKALKDHLGKKVSVEGAVVSTGKSSKDRMRFVNFSDSKTTGFTAALVPAVYPQFPSLDSMVGKNVRVTGNLETYKKKTIIKVTHATQLKTLEASHKEKSASSKAEGSAKPKPTVTKKKQAS